MNRIYRLCESYGLGNLKSEPEAVAGGLLHKMYHVSTDKGEYAIKVLNPNIMKRSEALHNTINSEIVSNTLKEFVPLVAANCFGGKYVVEFEEFFYVVFDWFDGKSVLVPNISEYHCEQVGRILGKIHSSGVKIDSIEKNYDGRAPYEWNELLTKAEQCHAECRLVLQESISDIIRWDNSVVNAWKQVSQNLVISHRDLDPKNIMWKDDEPYIIDWEAAGYINPFQELIEVMNYWISEKTGEYNKAKFDVMIQAYTESMNISKVNWDVILDCSFDGMLGWLEYSIKRALGVEGNGADDLQEGLQQTEATVYELKKYENQTEQLKNWINEFIRKNYTLR